MQIRSLFSTSSPKCFGIVKNIISSSISLVRGKWWSSSSPSLQNSMSSSVLQLMSRSVTQWLTTSAQLSTGKSAQLSRTEYAQQHSLKSAKPIRRESVQLSMNRSVTLSMKRCVLKYNHRMYWCSKESIEDLILHNVQNGSISCYA